MELDLTHPGSDAARKKDKIRSAWISFVGRIAAQIIGAIATVGLGVVVLNGHDKSAHLATPAATGAPTVLIATPVRTERETVIVVMPLESAASFAPSDIDRVVKAALTEVPGVPR